jgi:NAD(P)H dehydrogenase (quinone)
MMGLEQTFRESVLGETTSTVKELTGEAPRSLPEWLAENIGLFRN